MKLYLTGVALAALAITGPAFAEDLENTAARYGSRGSVLQISLSPSGNKVAFISPAGGHGEVLNVIDLAGDAQIRPVTGNTEKKGDLTRCDWATETRLICQMRGMGERTDGVLIPYSRTFAINEDGSDADMLSERQSFRQMGFRQDGGNIVALEVDGREDTILFTREYVKENTMNTRLANEQEGLGVDAINVTSGKRKAIERPDEAASHYVADENGELRLKFRALSDGNGYLTGDRVVMYREAGKGGWDRFEGVTVNGAPRPAFTPAAIDASRNVLYGYDIEDGYDVIVEVPLDGSQAGKMVMARGDVDVDSLIRIGRQRRVVGATYATEKRAVEYFDPELAKLASALGKALPDQPLINIIGASSDENILLIVASSDTDPGMVYRFDRSAMNLEPLLAVRDLLVERPMGRMTPVSYTATDGTEIPAYLTLPPGSDGKGLPTVVLPHGGPAARDEWGFDWIVQFFVTRGYAVLQPNYRGSAGYGEAWYGKNGYQSWETAIGDVNDAGRWLVSEGIADADKLVVAGWSYGGYAALQSQVVAPDLFKAVVAIAPVTDLEYLREDARRYTSFELRDRQLGTGPHIAAGSPRRHAEKFAAPVALFHGSLDVNVDVRHSRMMASVLEKAGKQVSYQEYEDLQHGLADSKVRTQMLIAIDTFLSDALAD